MDAPAAAPNLRRRVFELLDTGSTEHAGRLIDLGLIALILLNVAAAIADSVPDISARYGRVFSGIEIASVLVFSVEYAVRVWCAPEHSFERNVPDVRARLAYVLTPSALIDLLSVAPVYLALLTDTDLRSVLLLRLFRFFKLARYSPGLESLVQALSAERRALTACAIILFGLVLVAASVMHLVEGAAQPARFGTIPDAMYWAFITLTTVGYGDVVPITPLGKVVASLTAVLGIGMLALPVGILASAFADEIRQRDFVVTLGMVSKVPLFADLDAPAVAGIMRNLQARSVEPGEAIVQKGEAADAMFFISAGIVEVELPDRPAVRLGPGEFFGEIGLLQGRARTATVVAATRVRLLVLAARDLHYLMDHTPLMAERLREVAERRAGPGAAGARPGGADQGRP